MKHYKVTGIVCALVLITACFLPWTYHADVHENFTGFFSEQNKYGKPGMVFIFFSVVSILLISVPKIWAKRTHIFIAGLQVAYAIKTYILYASCYNAYCPEIRYGIILTMICVIIMLLVSIFPDVKLDAEKTANSDSTAAGDHVHSG